MADYVQMTKRIVAGVLLSSLLVVVHSSCRDTVIAMNSVVSPDGKYSADWFQVSGGGAASATDDSVCIRLSTDHPRLSRGCVFGGVDVGHIDLAWISSRELQITYPAGSQAGPRVSTWHDVRVTYALSALR